MDRGVVGVNGLRAFASSDVKTHDVFRDEEGFTTVGMVLALLITLSLLFSTAQVYRIASVAADVQDVADAVALAAENEVGEFMVVVRICDAIVLSLSLTGIVATGLGVAALCTPATTTLSDNLIAAGRNVLKARDDFAGKARDGLDRLQRMLPFLAAANGASVAAENNGGSLSSNYLGLAVLVPFSGTSMGIDDDAGTEELTESVDAEAAELRKAGEEAERAAEQANVEKEKGFLHDCGNAPGYCMYERAATLARVPVSDNPLYHSIDTWSFSVALERAKAYYRCRLAEEDPEGGGIEQQVKSALRKRFYDFAVEEVSGGYVYETSESFEALFPRLPRNTDEMRETDLYTDPVYPVSEGELGPIMHACPDCPLASGATTSGSIAQMEAEGYAPCPMCGFTAASLGKVAAASTSIENGFEYHYDAVAEACDAYQKARSELDPLSQEVKKRAEGLFSQCSEALERVAGQRIEAEPPGRFGVIALVAADGTAMSSGFESGFVSATSNLGTRVALSSATLVGDSAEGGKNVISSLLDSLADKGGVAIGAAGIVLDCWSGLLYAYLEGQEALDDALETAVDAIPFASASGLGTWASDTFRLFVGGLGLEPAKLDALKPVLVNSAHVSAVGESPFSARLLSVKKRIIAHPFESTGVFSSIVDGLERQALGGISLPDDRVEVASIELFGGEGRSIPISIALPPSATDAASGLIEGIADGLMSIYEQISGVRVWG